MIKVNSLFGHQGPCKPSNYHNLYIGIIIFPHIDNTQSIANNYISTNSLDWNRATHNQGLTSSPWQHVLIGHVLHKHSMWERYCYPHKSLWVTCALTARSFFVLIADHKAHSSKLFHGRKKAHALLLSPDNSTRAGVNSGIGIDTNSNSRNWNWKELN